jgi:sugar phosphate isomerase/epimerase
MRFGCCGSMISPATDPVGGRIVEELAALGFDYIELSLRDLVTLSERARAELASQLQRSGLACEACNNFLPPEVRLTGPSADLAVALRYAENALAVAAQIGAEVVIFGSAGARNVPEGFPSDVAWGQLRTFLNALAPIAERHGLTIAVEHLNRGESNVLNTVSEAWQMVQQVAQSRIQLLVDAYHLAQENEDPAVIVEVASAIAHVHVAERPERVFPSGGDARLAEFFTQLRASGYRQRCSIEAVTDDFSSDAARALRVCSELA